jgi:DNA-binding protein
MVKGVQPVMHYVIGVIVTDILKVVVKEVLVSARGEPDEYVLGHVGIDDS